MGLHHDQVSSMISFFKGKSFEKYFLSWLMALKADGIAQDIIHGKKSHIFNLIIESRSP